MNRRIFLLIILLIPLIAAVTYLFAPTPPLPELPEDFHADKAVWMGVIWSMDETTDRKIESLAQNLLMQEIDYAFVYVSYLKPGDFFNPTYDHAASFVERMRAAAPHIKWLAWIGIPISVTQPDGAHVSNRLTDPQIRQMIADFSAQIVREAGFDGVHLNAELILDGDAAFLDTLKTIREALPEDALLSTTAHALRLNAPITSLPYPIIDHHWSPEYLRQVVMHSDQVALMAYDSGLIFPSDYRAWMRYQVQMSSEALAGLDTDFLIGLPTSEEWTPSHHIHVESLANGLYGFYQAITDGNQSFVDGIAIYPYWETDELEWRQIKVLP